MKLLETSSKHTISSCMRVYLCALRASLCPQERFHIQLWSQRGESGERVATRNNSHMQKWLEVVKNDGRRGGWEMNKTECVCGWGCLQEFQVLFTLEDGLRVRVWECAHKCISPMHLRVSECVCESNTMYLTEGSACHASCPRHTSRMSRWKIN